LLRRPVPVTLPLSGADVGLSAVPNAIGVEDVATPSTAYSGQAGVFIPTDYLSALPAGTTLAARLREFIPAGATAALTGPPVLGPAAGEYTGFALDIEGVSAPVADTSSLWGVDVGLDAGAGLIEDTVAFAGYFGVYTEPPP